MIYTIFLKTFSEYSSDNIYEQYKNRSKKKIEDVKKTFFKQQKSIITQKHFSTSTKKNRLKSKTHVSTGKNHKNIETFSTSPNKGRLKMFQTAKTIRTKKHFSISTKRTRLTSKNHCSKSKNHNNIETIAMLCFN